MITDRRNKYAEKFFGEPKSKLFGEGFLEVAEEAKESRPKKLFPNVNDLLKR